MQAKYQLVCMINLDLDLKNQLKKSGKNKPITGEIYNSKKSKKKIIKKIYFLVLNLHHEIQVKTLDQIKKKLV